MSFDYFGFRMHLCTINEWSTFRDYHIRLRSEESSKPRAFVVRDEDLLEMSSLFKIKGKNAYSFTLRTAPKDPWIIRLNSTEWNDCHLMRSNGAFFNEHYEELTTWSTWKK